MRHALPTIVALLLVVSFGIAEGLWTERWNQSTDVDRAAVRCADVPRTIGDWEGADQELDSRQLALGKINGYMMRRYVHRGSDDAITVMLLCGRPGPVAVHTPDICFQGAGYEMKASPQRFKFDVAGLPGAPEFWGARFEKPGPGSIGSTVLWSWATDGSWTAADSPRVQFARSHALYKLYVIHPSIKPDTKPGDDPELEKFLQKFLPAVQNALFASPNARRD